MQPRTGTTISAERKQVDHRALLEDPGTQQRSMDLVEAAFAEWAAPNRRFMEGLGWNPPTLPPSHGCYGQAWVGRRVQGCTLGPAPTGCCGQAWVGRHGGLSLQGAGGSWVGEWWSGVCNDA